MLRDEVLTLDIDPQALGFDQAALDQALQPPVLPTEGDEPAIVPSTSRLRTDDLFPFGRHRLLLGDALNAFHGRLPMGDDRAHMSIDDFPFNVKIGGHVSTRKGRKAPREFAQASGEMSSDGFQTFLTGELARILESAGPVPSSTVSWT